MKATVTLLVLAIGFVGSLCNIASIWIDIPYMVTIIAKVCTTISSLYLPILFIIAHIEIKKEQKRFAEKRKLKTK